MKRTLALTFILIADIGVSPVIAAAGSTDNPAGIDAQRGKVLWESPHTVSGKTRSCTTCHTDDPRRMGKHARTGKPIKPMATSVNPDRFTDSKKMQKWFKRNCKWTLGRECTGQEKADVLEYLKTL